MKRARYLLLCFAWICDLTYSPERCIHPLTSLSFILTHIVAR